MADVRTVTTTLLPDHDRIGLTADDVLAIKQAIDQGVVTNNYVTDLILGPPIPFPDAGWDDMPTTLWGIPITYDGSLERGQWRLTHERRRLPFPTPSILDDARERVVEDRHEDYGPPVENMRITCDLWNAMGRARYGDRWCELKPADVAAFMRMLKEARIAWKPKRDSFVDIAGWAAVEEECER